LNAQIDIFKNIRSDKRNNPPGSAYDRAIVKKDPADKTKALLQVSLGSLNILTSPLENVSVAE
jgi:hypothetical protein